MAHDKRCISQKINYVEVKNREVTNTLNREAVAAPLGRRRRKETRANDLFE